jgi:hypothetical protein
MPIDVWPLLIESKQGIDIGLSKSALVDLHLTSGRRPRETPPDDPLRAAEASS